MSTALAPAAPMGATMEKVLLQGDLAKLTPEERLSYYNAVCTSVGLNPLTQPFAYISLNGKLTLYARKDCTDQLRQIHSVSIIDLIETERDGVYVVTAKAQNAAGRIDMAKGAVNLSSLKGEALANAIMKAETKAKRRVTLSICGLGFLDETETDSIPGAERPRFAETITESSNGHAPEKITAEMRKKLGETAKGRKIPTEIASAIVRQFGFAKTQDITVDKFNDVLQALCDWEPPVEIEPPASEVVDNDPDLYAERGVLPPTTPQPETRKPQVMTGKDSLKERKAEIITLGQQLIAAGVPLDTIESLIETKTGVREAKHVESAFDADHCIIALESLLEQAQKAKVATKKGK